MAEVRDNSSLTNEQALMVLNALPMVGSILCRRFLKRFQGKAVSVFNVTESELLSVKGVGKQTLDKILNWRKYFDLDKELSSIETRKLNFISLNNPLYPELLKEIYDPPIGYYHLGGMKEITQPCVSIVGTRMASLYGRKQARSIARELAKLGFCIVSGLARGIDYEAHMGAIDLGGKSIAVLGNGIDIIYPPEHFELYQALMKDGCVISEFPLGRTADKQSFPMRNRIVAGLSSNVVIVESGIRGGSMITANFATEYGREVFAVPGRLDQAHSLGCLKLIKEGATMFTSIHEFLEETQHSKEIQSIAQFERPKQTINYEILNDSERQIIDVLQGGERLSINQVAEAINENISAVNALMIQLELKHCLTKGMDGKYEV
ncbi:MAG: DNA-processing protein DprA [Opitutae bacterium]|nr:DNA-processing protein DprA [Opitutae bacterium]